jgi:hypothetical protein
MFLLMVKTGPGEAPARDLRGAVKFRDSQESSDWFGLALKNGASLMLSIFVRKTNLIGDVWW